MTDQRGSSTLPNSQLAPDALSTQAENELICEKLFGWKKRGCFSPYDGRFMGYDFLDGERPTTAPSFTTWAEAGLILEALGKCAEFPRIGQRTGDLHWYCALRGGVATIRESGPLAIRSAALEYIKAVKS